MGRVEGEPVTDSSDGALGQWIIKGFKHGSDMIRLTLTIILEKPLWLSCAEWLGEALGFFSRDTSSRAVSHLDKRH